MRKDYSALKGKTESVLEEILGLVRELSKEVDGKKETFRKLDRELGSAYNVYDFRKVLAELIGEVEDLLVVVEDVYAKLRGCLYDLYEVDFELERVMERNDR